MSYKSLLKEKFIEALSKLQYEDGFIFKKTKDALYQKSKHGWCRFSIILLNKNEGFEINTSVGIRINLVEDIYHTKSGFEKKYQNETSTIGCFVEDYIGEYKNFRVKLDSENDLKEAIQSIVNTHFVIAKEYFAAFNNLIKIDSLLNDNPDEETLHCNEIFRGCKGLITAKLTQRSDVDLLREIYRKKYIQFAEGFYLPTYEHLDNFLSSKDFTNTKSS